MGLPYVDRPLLTGQNILANIRIFHPNFMPGTWFLFVIYMAFTLYAVVINIFGIRVLDRLNSAAVFWSLLGAITITVSLLATAGAKGTLNDAKTTFTASRTLQVSQMALHGSWACSKQVMPSAVSTR